MDIYEKWTPILEALNVTDEKMRKFIPEYAEYYSKYSTELTTYIVEPKNDISQNLLPLSLKVLSQLNLKDKNVQIKGSLPTLSFSIDVEESQILAIKEAGIDSETIVIQLETMLRNLLVEHINKELETKNNLYITNIVQSISIMSSEGYKPRMYLHSRILID